VILVDTSVWLRFVRGTEPYASELGERLGRDEVLGHELVYGELLIGDRGGRRRLLVDYARMHRATTLAHAEVVELVRYRKLSGRGIGWIDAHLLASALVERADLWTADAPLAAVAEDLGASYRGAAAS
jgi:predicted nucleic acid-binding protein